MDERPFLEGLAATHTTADSPQDAAIRSMAMQAFMFHAAPHSDALELGCDFGYMTPLLEHGVDPGALLRKGFIVVPNARSRSRQMGLEYPDFPGSLFAPCRATS